MTEIQTKIYSLTLLYFNSYRNNMYFTSAMSFVGNPVNEQIKSQFSIEYYFNISDFPLRIIILQEKQLFIIVAFHENQKCTWHIRHLATLLYIIDLPIIKRWGWGM